MGFLLHHCPYFEIISLISNSVTLPVTCVYVHRHRSKKEEETVLCRRQIRHCTRTGHMEIFLLKWVTGGTYGNSRKAIYHNSEGPFNEILCVNSFVPTNLRTYVRMSILIFPRFFYIFQKPDTKRPNNFHNTVPYHYQVPYQYRIFVIHVLASFF